MIHDHVNRFVSLVYPAESGWIALCLIPPDAQMPEHRFMTVGKLPRFLGYASHRNANGWGVYITPSLLKPNSRNRCKTSFEVQQMVVYLDCDHSHCLNRIKQRYPRPTLVVRTSTGRHQVYWRLAQPADTAAQERLMRAMAIDVGADRAATDVSRVLRLPGFWNRKPGRYNIVDIVFSRNHCVSYQSLSEKARSSCRYDFPNERSPLTTMTLPPVLVRRPQSPDISESEKDWYEVHRRLALNHLPEDVVGWLQAKRSDKPNPRYYAELTVRKALESRSTNKRPPDGSS